MLLPRLIKIAFILKDLQLDKFITGEKVDITGLIEHLKAVDETRKPNEEKIIIQLAKAATGSDIVNELDAEIGLVNFFLQLLPQLKISQQARILINYLPLKEEQKIVILNLLGKT